MELASVLPPSGITNARANDRIELQVFRITGLPREAADEDDQDIELIVTDPKQPGISMLVEFPATACTHGALAKLRRQMSKARANFMRPCGGPGPLQGVATITGVGFWDRPHAAGTAQNGLELHPVLGFTGTCT